MSFESFNTGYFETRSPENIELGRQQRIKLNKEWYAKGNDTNRQQEYAIHYGRLQGVDSLELLKLDLMLDQEDLETTW